MDGKDNLIPTSKRTKDEQREIAKKGGIKSGEIRREKKRLKQRLEMVLELMKDELIGSVKKSGKSKQEIDNITKQIEEMGADGYQLAKIAFSNKVKAETRLRALESIWDRTEGKPSQDLKLSTPKDSSLDVTLTVIKPKDES